jgi:hypothetical protein
MHPISAEFDSMIWNLPGAGRWIIAAVKAQIGLLRWGRRTVRRPQVDMRRVR